MQRKVSNAKKMKEKKQQYHEKFEVCKRPVTRRFPLFGHAEKLATMKVFLTLEGPLPKSSSHRQGCQLHWSVRDFEVFAGENKREKEIFSELKFLLVRRRSVQKKKEKAPTRRPECRFKYSLLRKPSAQGRIVMVDRETHTALGNSKYVWGTDLVCSDFVA